MAAGAATSSLSGAAQKRNSRTPGVTLFVLDAFRFSEHLNENPALDRAVASLLDHWTVRRPLGPCQFGIGTLFMQVEYPFLRYNLFSYVYVLSFYQRARADERFLEALSILRSKLDPNGQMVVERPNRKLAALSAFAKGQPSQPATDRYQEVVDSKGRPFLAQCWRWSDASYGEARRSAWEAINEITKKLRDNERIDRHAYGERPLRADPLYVTLCKNQASFRARLTPKPWRCGVETPPNKYPWEDETQQQRYRRWEDRYERVIADFTTCRLVAVIGRTRPHRDAAMIQGLHDRYACVDDKFRLA